MFKRGTEIMKKKLFTILMGTTLAFSLAACGSDSDKGKDDTATNGETVAGAGDEQKIYDQKCSMCHGDNLEGKSAPALKTVGATYDKDGILEIINNGKGRMPKGTVKGEEAEKVAEWLANKK